METVRISANVEIKQELCLYYEAEKIIKLFIRWLFCRILYLTSSLNQRDSKIRKPSPDLTQPLPTSQNLNQSHLIIYSLTQPPYLTTLDRPWPPFTKLSWKNKGMMSFSISHLCYPHIFVANFLCEFILFQRDYLLLSLFLTPKNKLTFTITRKHRAPYWRNLIDHTVDNQHSLKQRFDKFKQQNIS